MIKFSDNVKKEDLQKALQRKLDLFERYCDIDVVATSGLRSIKKNKDAGGSPTSSHLGGFALDIFIENGAMYTKVRKYAEWAGFTRFGHASDHMHIDCDPKKPPNCEWWEE